MISFARSMFSGVNSNLTLALLSEVSRCCYKDGNDGSFVSLNAMDEKEKVIQVHGQGWGK